MTTETTPPKNTRRIWRVSDLPPDRSRAEYVVRNDGAGALVTLAKRKRQIMNLLRQAPVYCASPVRISAIVFLLKTDSGIDIEALRFPGDPATGSGPYGVYVLRSEVYPLIEMEVAS